MSHSFDFISKQDLSSHQTENIQNVSNYGSIEQKDEKVDELSKRMEDMMNRRSIDVPAKPMRQ